MSTAESAAYTRYETVAADLKRRILSGELREGDRLASEAEMAAEYRASRGTIRRTLALLKESNLVTTKAGSGSYVAFHKQSLTGPKGWTATLADVGIVTTTELLSTELVNTPAELRSMTDESECFRIIRRRALEDVPISLETSVIPANDRMRAIMEHGLLGGSISQTLRATGMKAIRGHQDVSVRPLPVTEAVLLQADKGSMHLLSVRVGFGHDDQLVEQVESWLDPKHFSLHLTFQE